MPLSHDDTAPQSRLAGALGPSVSVVLRAACAMVMAASFFGPSANGADNTEVADTNNQWQEPIEAVGLSEIRWTRGFWADRMEMCRQKMIPAMWRLMEGTNDSQYFYNFQIAAGLKEGRHRGAPFNDGDFYKWLEGACAAMAAAPDPEWNRRIDGIVGVMARAQRADGYLHTPVLIAQRCGDANARPFQNPLQFELYNMGHLLTAACVHHRVTGKTDFLAIARKAAEYLDAAFEHPTPDLARFAICPSHFMGLVDLYRTTREARYLELARRLFAMRSLVRDGGDDNQDRIPFLEQTNAMGHAVRANYLYAGAADLVLETREQRYWKSLESIWTNVVGQKMYITGGCGALFDGASPDGARNQRTISRVHQAYGRSYQLPNLTAHNETCANIGNVLWNWRMFRATGEARFMDIVELALYNSVLCGVGLDGTNYFYVNPLRQLDPLPIELRWSRTRVPYVNSFCCPPNIARTIAEVGGYAYGKSRGTIWVNLYGSGALKTTIPNAAPVNLIQETEYPWNGRVRLTIAECGSAPFALKLRIPGWAKAASVRVNDRPVDSLAAPGSYFEIRRTWHSGDRVELEIAMPVQMIEANPFVEETLNQVALKRGPIVYCLESPDLPAGIGVLDVRIPIDADFVARYDARLLRGVVVLEASLPFVDDRAWQGQLYRARAPRKLSVRTTKLIPYYAWANRGKSEMSVWLPAGRP